MPRYLSHLDITGNQLKNAVMHRMGADPGSPVKALMWFHDTAGADGQGRMKIQLNARTMTIDDQYVSSVVAGGTPNGIVIGGTALAPTVSMNMASGAQIGAMSIAHYNLLAGATDAATNSALVQRDANGKASFTELFVSGTPTLGTSVVNRDYVQSLAAGFDPKGSCVLATTGALPACTYNNGTAGVGATLMETGNGALTTTLIDGTAVYTLQVGDRILVKNQASAFQNGIYVVTALGNAGAPFVLTRATDYNTAAAGPGQVTTGSFLFVETGANATTQWVMGAFGAVTMGTTNLTFTQFGAASVYTNGNGLSLGGNTFSVNLTGTNTLEFNSGALRVKSSATANQVLLSGGTGNEPSYGALPLGNASAVTGTLGKANGGFGQDVSTGIAQNLFAASPNGGSGAMSFRAIVKEDFPTTGLVGAGTYTKVTFDAYGRPTGSSTLATGDIPNLDFSKITTGIVPSTQGGTGLNLASIKDAPTAQHLPARVVATTNLSIAAPGATIDGVSMAAGDRVLLVGQTTTSQNGLWIWNSAGGAMSRPTDFPAASTAHAYYGVTVEVLSGTANAGTSWYLSTTGAITIDTNNIAFTQVTYNLASGITGQVPVTNGGTGSGTAAGARANLGAAGVYATTITGDGVTLNFTVTHNLNSNKVKAIVTDPTASNEEVFPDIQYTSVNAFSVRFGIAPTNGLVYGVAAEG